MYLLEIWNAYRNILLRALMTRVLTAPLHLAKHYVLRAAEQESEAAMP